MLGDEAAATTTIARPGSAHELDSLTPDRPKAIARTPPAGEPLVSPTRRQRPSSPETLRLYAMDWATFEDWCGRQSLVPLPAAATSVAAFLDESATTLSAGTLIRRAAAIAAKHRQSGVATPTTDPTVTAILRRARQAGTPRRAPRKTPAVLIRMAVRCPHDFAGTRDRALLLLAASGLGRAALVGLDVEHIRFTATAAEFSFDSAGVEAGAGAEEGRGVPVSVGRAVDRTICPVQALCDWLETSDTRFGPVFRKIDRWGTLEHHRLGTDAIRRILTRRSLRRSSLARSVRQQSRAGV
jgi:hypothetical protein